MNISDKHVFVTTHTLKRYRKHHPGAQIWHCHNAISNGIRVHTPTALTMVGRASWRPTTSIYILSPDRRGFFVLEEWAKDRPSKFQYTSITYLRFGTAQHKFALENWPLGMKPETKPKDNDDGEYKAPWFKDLGCAPKKIRILPRLADLTGVKPMRKKLVVIEPDDSEFDEENWTMQRFFKYDDEVIDEEDENTVEIEVRHRMDLDHQDRIWAGLSGKDVFPVL